MKKKNDLWKIILYWLAVFIFLGILCMLTSCLQVSAITPTAAPTRTARRDPTSTAESTQAVAPLLPVTGQHLQCTITAESLNVRGGPSTASAGIGYLKRGEVVSILEWDNMGNGWARIGTVMWINADFCEMEKIR